MAQKVIKIGSSLGITIPKKQVTGLNLAAGDEVEITIRKKVTRTTRHSELLTNLDGFMETYSDALKHLAQR